MPSEKKIIESLKTLKKTLSIAESCTGGLLAHRFTNVPGSSEVLKLGIVVYSNQAKIKFLNVPRGIIEKYGAVSRETAKLMAGNVRRLVNTDYGISITGVAGPSNLENDGKAAPKQKPAGLVFIALATKRKTTCLKFLFKGSRIQVKNKAVQQALTVLTTEGLG